MKPAPFAYTDPESLDEALDLLQSAGDDAVAIAGGQSLVPLLNLRLARPRLVIDLRRIAELTTFVFDPHGLRAGAMVRLCQLEEDAAASGLPGLLAALRHIGHRQIRARSTVGGTVAHGDPAAELTALLVAVDGVVELASRERGSRTVPAGDFFVGPYTTSRQPDELVVGLHLPAVRGDVLVTEIAKRPGDFALAGAIVGLARDGDSVSDARVCLFGVADRPRRMTSVERALVGACLDASAIGGAGRRVQEELEASSDVHASAAYRRSVAATLVERSLEALAS